MSVICEPERSACSRMRLLSAAARMRRRIRTDLKSPRCRQIRGIGLRKAGKGREKRSFSMGTLFHHRSEIDLISARLDRSYLSVWSDNLLPPPSLVLSCSLINVRSTLSRKQEKRAIFMKSSESAVSWRTTTIALDDEVHGELRKCW